MKIKHIANILLINFFILAVAQTASSQSWTATTFKNGITVAINREYSTQKGKGYSGYGTGSKDRSRNIVHEVIADVSNKIFFGYDLEVVPLKDKTKFKVLIKPLSIRPNGRFVKTANLRYVPLPKHQGEIIVEDGDTIVLDVMKNPRTKEKISDLIIITRNGTAGNLFAYLNTANDFTLNDVNLKLNKAEFFLNSKKLGTSGGSSGSNIYFYIRGKGRFIISPFQRKGYEFQKIAIGLNNKINFSYKGDKYEIVSQLPVLGQGGKWHLWVMHDKKYVPRKPIPPELKFQVGSGSIKGLFLNRRTK